MLRKRPQKAVRDMSASQAPSRAPGVSELTLWAGQITSRRMTRHPLRPRLSANRGFEARP